MCRHRNPIGFLWLKVSSCDYHNSDTLIGSNLATYRYEFNLAHGERRCCTTPHCTMQIRPGRLMLRRTLHCSAIHFLALVLAIASSPLLQGRKGQTLNSSSPVHNWPCLPPIYHLARASDVASNPAPLSNSFSRPGTSY
jgi:hypothetical protein